MARTAFTLLSVGATIIKILADLTSRMKQMLGSMVSQLTMVTANFRSGTMTSMKLIILESLSIIKIISLFILEKRIMQFDSFMKTTNMVKTVL
jgi:hypothetical protein